MATEEGAKPVKKKLTRKEKLELRKQKQMELKKQTIKNHLMRELKYTQISYERGEKDWEHMCAKLKAKESKEELMRLRNEISCIMESRDLKIRELLKRLDQNEKDYQMNFSYHTQVIDSLLDFYNYALDVLKKNYENLANKEITNFSNDKNELEEISNNRNTFYESVYYTSKLKSENDEKIKTDDFNLTKRRKKAFTVNEQYRGRDKKVEEMNDMYKEFKTIIKNIQKEIDNPVFKENYEKFSNQNEKIEKEVQKINSSIDKAQETINRLRNILNKLENSNLQTFNELKYSLNNHIQLYWKSKKNYLKNQKCISNILGFIIEECSDSIQELKKIETFGERLYRLHKSCKQLEIQGDYAQWSSKCKNDLENRDELSNEMLIERFWNKVAYAQMQVLHLKDEKQKLIQDKMQYCSMLQNYFQTLCL